MNSDAPITAHQAELTEAWRALATKELQGQPVERLTTRSAEGARVEPLYPAEPRALPG
ncbi:MAG: hypothetical protein JNK56_25535, partial [Myxococcales bacterium]|nr:hypothetical protein [Myxococcales bacterium]